ncbi:MAG: phosphate transport system permease protein [Actinomycetota bacterium]|nr:phosphate transport system permease protein [Actinomycetota bacterium]
MSVTAADHALRRPRLGGAHIALLVMGATGMTAALFARTALQGRADFLLVVFLLSATAVTVATGVVEGARAARSRLAITVLYSTLALALIPLVAVLTYTVNRGSRAISIGFLTHSMKGVGPLDAGGGAYHAIIGTLEQVLIASGISVPVGLLTAIYLVEYGRGRLAGVVRFVVDVMTGIPSIVAGLFVFAFWVLGLHKGFSGMAAGLALAVLMVPIVVRASEEMLKLVPADLREASWALGVPRWRTILSVVLPTASAGLTTAVMLAVARVTGETAPLLLTAFGFDAIKTDPFHGPQSALPLYVFSQAGSAFDVAVNRAWAGALTLIAVVLLLTTAARLLTRRNRLV